MDRRTSLKAAGLLSVAPAIMRATRADAAPGPFDANNPEHVGMAYRKLGWNAEDKFTMHWIRLTRYGMVDSKLHTMWESLIGILFTTKDAKDGNPGDYDVTSLSLSFMLDPKTGAMMEKYNNPWTGETLDIPYGSSKPNTRRQKLTGMDIGMKAPPGMKADASSSRVAWSEGGEVWVRGDLDIRMESESGKAVMGNMGQGGSGTRSEASMARLMQVNDWFTYHGKASDVTDPNVKNPPSDLYFNDLNTWSGWLKMGDKPGNFVGRGFGRKVFKYEDMPAEWRKLVAQKYPDVAKDPEKAIRG